MNFEPGNTYQTRSICNSDCIISATIVSRTAKTVTLSEGYMGSTQTKFRISQDWQGNECFRPWGSYSMCPTISADDKVKS